MKTIFTLATALLLAGALTTSPLASNCSSGTADKTYGATKAKAEGKMDHKHDIIETAISTDGFGTLVTAIKVAGLVETLKGDGPFTVFAPTDDAFAALPEGAVEDLLNDKEKLTSVLTYHVVAGKHTASDVIGKDQIETVQGQKASVSTVDGKAMIDGARIVTTDIICSNGIIHVIDAVILPGDKEQASNSKY
jgi:uncharacterized surface protein with fasciclin (FAS1) repeats